MRENEVGRFEGDVPAEGKNVIIERRFAEGRLDRYDDLLAELIDDQLVLGRMLDWKIAGLRSIQNLPDIDRGVPNKPALSQSVQESLAGRLCRDGWIVRQKADSIDFSELLRARRDRPRSKKNGLRTCRAKPVSRPMGRALTALPAGQPQRGLGAGRNPTTCGTWKRCCAASIGPYVAATV
jgi:hypothetical protein